LSERLQKFLARAGVASRRAAETLITQGRVAVNGKAVLELGTKVEPHDAVSVDGKPVAAAGERAWFLLHKPAGVVTTLTDPQGRPTVRDLVEKTGRRVFPVGRLDYDAEGALLFTDDGETANRLLHPRYQVPRTYLVKVKGDPTDATLEKLRGGVRLEDGMATPQRVERFERAEANTWVVLVVTEGRPHLVKRLCAAVGHPVVRLYRPAQAGIGIGKLEPGELRALKPEEIAQVHAVAKGEPPAEVELKLPPRRHRAR
jgi:23S rRNA pseudouridine2605 synthase